MYRELLESVIRESLTVTVVCLSAHATPQVFDAPLTSEEIIRLLDMQGCSSICNPRMTFPLARIDVMRLDKQRYVK